MTYYAIVVDGRCYWDGRATAPPAPGDQVRVDGKTFLVQRRVWDSAEHFGANWMKARQASASDLVSVTLHCIEVTE